MHIPYRLSICANLILLAFAGIGISGTVHAQSDQNTNAAPPSPPYLKRTPDHSVLSLTVQGSPEGESASLDNNSTGSSDQKTPVVAQSRVMKSGDTIYEQNVDDQGHVYEIWHVRGLRVEKSPSSPIPIVGPDSGGGDIYSVDFQNSDFAGLDWLSEQSYTGKVKYQGADVIVFKQDVNPLPANVRRANDSANALAQTVAMVQAERNSKSGQQGPMPASSVPKLASEKLVPATAYIDLQSRLPLIVTIGGEKRIYQYAPLTSAIPMPPEVSKALSDYEERIKSLSQ